jgi:hypothetical protein
MQRRSACRRHDIARIGPGCGQRGEEGPGGSRATVNRAFAVFAREPRADKVLAFRAGPARNPEHRPKIRTLRAQEAPRRDLGRISSSRRCSLGALGGKA